MQILLFKFFLLFLPLSIFAQVGGQLPIAPTSIPQFVDPLPHFAGLRVDAKTGANLIVKMVPHDQIALSTGTPVNGGTIGGVIDPLINPSQGKAHLWVYQISKDGGFNFTPPYWPAFTIEAQQNNPIYLHQENQLSGESYDKVGLIADQTLHWADPLVSGHSMNPYAGEPPTVIHLHGGEVSSLSDGNPDSWFTPGNAQVGLSWGFGVTNDYSYLNTQRGATVWYHDHALGVTRLNVYAGMAGYYFLRGTNEDALHLPGWSGDGMVKEVPPAGSSGIFNPNPYLPEIEIAIQDRMFDTNGKLYFPNLPTNPMVHPFWTPEFVGDIITVNGKTWPYLSVAPRKYRFRILNGSNARTYELFLENLVTEIFGPAFKQIGTDGGFLDVPVTIDPVTGKKLILMPGERADVIIDFSASPIGTVWTMKNTGKTPYPAGTAPKGTTTGRILQFVVNGQLVGADNSVIPGALNNPPLVKLTNFAGGLNVTPAVKRQLTLNEVMGMGGPLEILVNNTKWDGNGPLPGLGVTETPTEGTSEVWQIINLTADAHPIHLHLVQYQIVSRQKFNKNTYAKAYNVAFPGGVYIGGFGPPLPYNTPNLDGTVGGNPAITPYLQGPVTPAALNERGWKDTFIMYPGEVTTVVVRFAPTDMPLTTPQNQLLFAFNPSTGPGYVWHCHILDHEDNEMMRPYSVNPNPSRLLPKSGTTLTENLPTSFELNQNYPNPFNPSTVINFSVPKENTLVTLKIYNSLGEEVGTLINQIVPAGNHEVNFDARGLSSGVYFYTLTADNFVDSKKMVLMK
jgi:FtsP/CotA-like multicopper oxidase with cupredoxin domain